MIIDMNENYTRDNVLEANENEEMDQFLFEDQNKQDSSEDNLEIEDDELVEEHHMAQPWKKNRYCELPDLF